LLQLIIADAWQRNLIVEMAQALLMDTNAKFVQNSIILHIHMLFRIMQAAPFQVHAQIIQSRIQSQRIASVIRLNLM